MPNEFIWQPSQEVIARANTTRLANKHGLPDFQALLARSVDDVEWFWDAVVKDLGIEFDSPYVRVLDDSAGIQWTRWFTDSQINIAHNCVDRHRSLSSTAIIAEREDGSTSHVSYEALASDVAALASGLRRLDVHKGDAVGLFLPMVPEAVVALMACAKIGAIVVPLFSGFAAPAIAARLNDAEARVLICADGFSRRGSHVDMKAVADVAAESVSSLHNIVVAKVSGADVSMKSGRDVSWAQATAGGETHARTEPTDSEDPFMIAYTSGTTGKPKGAVHVHGGFLVKIASEVAYQTDYQPGEILYWFSDMGWIMGPWQVVGTLALGGTIFMYEGAPDFPDNDRIWAMIERHRINILGISPTLVRAMMRYGDDPVRSHDLSSLRVLGSTGEPWNDAPYRWFFNAVGGGRCPIINFSGGTEVGACFLSPTVAQPLKVGSLGGPALGIAADVYGPDAKPIRGDVGELVCTKPWPGMTRGIWGDPDRYIQTYWSRWPDIWVHGDWAVVDDDGQWFLQGRSDDTMNVAGKRIGPAEVESALVTHPGVSEAAVIGVPHDVKGEAIWCFVVTVDSAAPPTSDELKSQVASELGKAFRPERVLFVSQLPKTRNAKVLRRAVRAVALGLDAGDLSSLENPQSLDEIKSSLNG